MDSSATAATQQHQGPGQGEANFPEQEGGRMGAA